jgi:NAD(P)-dependent dehydrogenase (short-subunit alcohol dehydrogenase family)
MDDEYLDSLFALSGKVAVVTGGGGVLCGVMSNALGRLGVKVAVLDIAEEAAQRVADEIAAEP